MPDAIKTGIENKLVQEQEALEYEFRLQKAEQEAGKKTEEESGKESKEQVEIKAKQEAEEEAE